MITKNSRLFRGTAALAFSIFLMTLPHAFAQTSPSNTTRLEIPVKTLLTPNVGFEEKNNIQVVFYGFLPNGCYTLSNSEVLPESDGNAIQVKQYAIHDSSGVCADENLMPDQIKMRIPFTSEVSVGTLLAGNYRFLYRTEDDKRKVRNLTVSKNRSPGVDSLPYAAISSVDASDLFGTDESVKVKIRGVLNSSCTTLDQKVQILDEDDVFVLLPTISVKPGVVCAQMMIPFEREVDLGKTFTGIHLIHVRSMNGKSVNKVIDVSQQL